MKIHFLSPFLFFFICVSACVTPYQPETQMMAKTLVVEGLITDQPGPYTVKLTQTADYSNKSLNLLVTGAKVTLSDNAGNQEVLRETGAGGTYHTSPTGIRGVAGRIYKLTIQTTDGKRYESDPELLKTSPPVLKAYYEFRRDPYAIGNDKISGWDVYVDTKDPATTGDYYRWSYTHYEPISICRSVLVDPQNSVYEDFYCCTPCWDIIRCYDCLNINSDANINGQTLSRQFIMRVPFTSTLRYYLEIEQQSISRGVFQFLNSVKKLTQNNGGLFDAAPASVRGNIRCTSHPGDTPYGYFGAAGVTVVPLLVDRTDAIGNPPFGREPNVPLLAPCARCENSEFRTSVKPRWYN